MAVLAADATFQEFCDYTQLHRGKLSKTELIELWQFREKTLGLNFNTQRGWRAKALAPHEQHLTRNEREQKVIAEAKAQGRNIEKV